MYLLNKQTLELAKEDDGFLNDLLKSEESNKFVKYVIKEYTKSPAKFMAVNKVEWEDLLQAAYIGLFSAIRKLDLTLTPNEWIRYMYLTIQGELRSFSRSNDSNMVVIPQRIRELYPKYRKFHEEYWTRYQDDPSISETMHYFEISRDDAFALVYGMQDLIYQQYRPDQEDHEPFYNLRSSDLSVEDTAINHIIVKMYLDYINEKQRNVIYLHYFIGYSKTEISTILGCSPAMVTKHLKTAFARIRKELGLCS